MAAWEGNTRKFGNWLIQQMVKSLSAFKSSDIFLVKIFLIHSRITSARENHNHYFEFVFAFTRLRLIQQTKRFSKIKDLVKQNAFEI